MKAFCSFVVLLVALGLAATAEGGEPGRRCWPWPWRSLYQRCPCCPDDYCRKELPAAPCRAPGGADDYCPKALPHVAPLKYHGVDDYCPKGCPIRLAPCPPPWYTCGPKPDPLKPGP